MGMRAFLDELNTFEVCLSDDAYMCTVVDGRLDHNSFDDAASLCIWQDAAIQAGAMQWLELSNQIATPLNIVHMCTHGDYHIFELGAFQTVGGSDWTTVMGSIEETLPTISDDAIAVSEAFLGNVDDQHHIIGYPPLHQHHFHLRPRNVDMSDLQVHGDSQCHRDDGGKYCYLRRAPPGYAFYVASPIGFSTEFNDVRTYRSAPLDSRVMLAIKVIHNMSTRARQYGWYWPAAELGVSNMFYVMPGPCLSNTDLCPRACCIKTNEESVAWAAYRTDWQGQNLFYTWGHEHPSVVADVLMFQGNSSNVFDDSFQLGPQHSISYGSHAVAHMQNSIIRRSRESGAARLACTYRRSTKQEDIMISGKLQHFGRLSRCILNKSISGIVIVAFFAKQNEGVPKVAGVHAFWAVYAGKQTFDITLPSHSAVFKRDAMHFDAIMEPH